MIASLRRHLATPVLARDLRVRMRRRRTALLLSGCLAVVITAGLAAYALSAGSGDAAAVMRAGAALFRASAAATLVLVSLLGVTLGAGSISGERERGTLESLQATPLPPWRLALGKLLDTVLLLGLVALVPLPLDGMALYLGGVDGGTVGAFIAVCLGAALVTTALGVLSSAVAPSTAAALAGAAAALLVVSAVPLATGVVVTSGSAAAAGCSGVLCPAQGPPAPQLTAASVAPLTAALPLLVAAPGQPATGVDWWRRALPEQAGVAALLVAAASLVLRRWRWR